MRVHVECVADYRGVEMPRRFHLGRRKVEIVESDDQWHGADYRYFKVKGDDGNVYILRFDQPSSEWDLTMFQSLKAHMPQRMNGCKIIPLPPDPRQFDILVFGADPRGGSYG